MLGTCVHSVVAEPHQSSHPAVPSRFLPVVLLCLPVAVHGPPSTALQHTHTLPLRRFIFFAFPLLRKARGIQKVLDDAPQPGARGLVKDVLKLMWGECDDAVM